MQGAKAIAELLKNNSILRVLELNNNMIDYSVCSNLKHSFYRFKMGLFVKVSDINTVLKCLWKWR